MNLFEDLGHYLLFPDANRCAFCNSYTKDTICPDCEKKLLNLRCIDACSCYYYDGLVRQIIHDLKFNNKRYIYRAVALIMSCSLPKGDIITNVPISAKRKRTRGYDQSELIAKEIARICGVKYIPLLKKIKDTPAQSALDAAERRKNVIGAYECLPFSDIADKKIILIDDVITTGATMEECKKILYKNNIKNVTSFSFAKTK